MFQLQYGTVTGRLKVYLFRKPSVIPLYIWFMSYSYLKFWEKKRIESGDMSSNLKPANI